MAPTDVPAARQVRVLHVLEAIRGGTSRHVVDLVRSTPDVAHHVAVPHGGRTAAASGAVVDRKAMDVLVQAGALLHPVEMHRTPVHPANLTASRALRKLIRSIRPDVVHGHSQVGGAMARIAAIGLRTPVFYTPNGLSPNRLLLRVERVLGRLTTMLIAVSASEATFARDSTLVSPMRVTVVPNGIDLEPPAGPSPDLRTLAGIPAGAQIVGSVIRLVPQKAPHLLVEVCSEVAKCHPDVHFLLVGLGPLQDDLDRAVTHAGLRSRWHQIPHLPEAAAAMDQLDVFVLFSAFEGGPYTPLEAMRSGVPVVLTDVVGNRDVVEPGVSGLIAPFGDVKALAEAVSSLLEDPGHARAIAVAGRRRLESCFSLTAMGASMTDLYRRASEGAYRVV